MATTKTSKTATAYRIYCSTGGTEKSRTLKKISRKCPICKSEVEPFCFTKVRVKTPVITSIKSKKTATKTKTKARKRSA